MRLKRIVPVLVVAIGFGAMTSASEQGKNDPAKYAPVLPAVKARALPVDPAKGYLVKQVKPSVFVITDGVYQSAFVTTGQGVILIDAPESFASHIPRAVAEVTKEPIAQVIYSHTPRPYRWSRVPGPTVPTAGNRGRAGRHRVLEGEERSSAAGSHVNFCERADDHSWFRQNRDQAGQLALGRGRPVDLSS